VHYQCPEKRPQGACVVLEEPGNLRRNYSGFGEFTATAVIGYPGARPRRESLDGT
jgi:hypothetical protein